MIQTQPSALARRKATILDCAAGLNGRVLWEGRILRRRKRAQ
jgi:hypothetical protein